MFPLKGFYRKHLPRNNLSKIAYIRFISSFSIAAVATIWSLYLNSFLHNPAYVGFLSSFFTIILFFSFFMIVPLLEKYDKAKLFSFSLGVLTIVFFLLGFITNFYLFFIFAIVFLLAKALSLTSYGILIKDNSSRKDLAKNEGFVYSLLNIAWIIGPLVAGYIAFIYNLRAVFILGGFFMLLSFVLFKRAKIVDNNIKKRIDKNFLKNLKDFLSNKDRVYSYFISGGISIWWVLIFIFVPLYIVENGLGEIIVGYFLVGIGIPLVLFEYYFSKIAEKKGFKKLFKTGYFLVFIVSILCFFISNIYLLLGLLIFASLGIAMIEPTSEAYFFDIVKKNQDLRFYAPYNTTIVFHEFIGKISAAIVLLFLPFNYLFLLFGGFMLMMFFISLRMRDVFECKRKD